MDTSTTSNSELRYRGSIVRIRLKNFMTYNDTELKPGPNLNMILGPNGTGKSAIVCSIIVGLAGEVSLTGRGGSPADFVKKHTDSGSTEIELYNDSGSNYVVQRTIFITNRTQFKTDHKSEWKINKKNVLKSEVQALTRRLNIKVDNLCQFLPQDSVTQFVKMNTCELLLNTLKAAGDNQLVEDHQRLVDFTKEIEEKRKALENLEKASKENEVNARRLEAEVHQLRQREQLVKERAICNKKIYYVKFQEAKKNCAKVRAERAQIKEDLRKVENSSEPYRLAAERHKEEEIQLRQSLDASSREVTTVSDSIQRALGNIENRKINCQEEFAKFRGKEEQEKHRESTIRLKQQELQSYECRLNQVRDVDCTRQIVKVEAEIAKIKKERSECSQNRYKFEDAQRSLVRELDDLKREMEQVKAVKEKKANLLKTKSTEAYKVIEWLSRNQNKFSKQIFWPMMCEINVKDPKYNRVVEHVIPRQELTSFVCQTTEDLMTFTRSVRDELKIRFNVVLMPDKTLEEFKAEAVPISDFQGLGVKSYLLDLIDAPEPILRYLCGNNNFHRIPVAENCNQFQVKQLLAKSPRFFVDNNFYTTTKSRYDGETMIVTDPIREAQHLVFSLDSKRLSDCRAKIISKSELRDKAKKDLDELNARDDQLKVEWQAITEKHRELKTQHDEKRRLETLIQRTREAVSNLQTERIDIEVERRKLQQSIDKINGLMIKDLEKLITIYQNYTKAMEMNRINKLLSILAGRNHKLARKKFADAQRDTERLKNDLKTKEVALQTFNRALEETREALKEKITGFDGDEIDDNTQRIFATVEENTVDALTLKKENLTLRIQRIYKDSNNSILDEFNRQNEELKDKRIRIAELQSSVQQIDDSREAIRKNWVPKLEEVIKIIDENYRSFMQKLSYDGQVKIDFNPAEPNNFASYGIMILVKYRDNEQLIPLSSTRQSGGERSVATMIYMLALQTKTTVPFRCVDEINQGMDKENERKVFELLVQTADSSSSQYFLVSPKLLSNLPYSEKMRIHVVFNGKKLKLAWNDI